MRGFSPYSKTNWGATHGELVLPPPSSYWAGLPAEGGMPWSLRQALTPWMGGRVGSGGWLASRWLAGWLAGPCLQKCPWVRRAVKEAKKLGRRRRRAQGGGHTQRKMHSHY